MSDRDFRELIEARWAQGKFLCIGLDPDAYSSRFPSHLLTRSVSDALYAFCGGIVDETKDIAAAYKPNCAFFEAYGAEGVDALRRVVAYIHHIAPGVPVILDGKRGDVDTTDERYAVYLFDYLAGDATTVSPYLGRDGLEPFFARKTKGIFALCRTSNKSAPEFQDLPIRQEDGTTRPLYRVIAKRIAMYWPSNCGLVVGATYPTELAEIRQECDLPILIPGVGKQKGDLAATMAAAPNRYGTGFLINSSSGIIYAGGDSKEYARKAREEALRLDGAIRALIREKIE